MAKFKTITFSAWCLFLLLGQIQQELHGQSETLPPKIQTQINQIVWAYNNGFPYSFTRHSTYLIKRTKTVQIDSINKQLKQRKLPSLQDMIGEVRVRSMIAKTRLPKITWQEFVAVLPFLDQQIAKAKHELVTSEYFRESIPPTDLLKYEDKLWDLHVFRNRFQALYQASKHAKSTTHLYKRNVEAEKSRESATFKMIQRLPEMSRELLRLSQLLDEREAEFRVHRIAEAETKISLGNQFQTRLHAAFALADDKLFFDNFLATLQKEHRKLVNQDLNDQPTLKLLVSSIEEKKLQHGRLFEKAGLLYVGAHWWLRGRYGQGPLANGLLKVRDVQGFQRNTFPLIMPASMPSPQKLVGGQSPYQTIRRHNYVWGLGADLFHGTGPELIEDPKEDRTNYLERVNINLDKFY